MSLPSSESDELCLAYWTEGCRATSQADANHWCLTTSAWLLGTVVRTEFILEVARFAVAIVEVGNGRPLLLDSPSQHINDGLAEFLRLFAAE